MLGRAHNKVMRLISGIRSLVRIPGFLHDILSSALPPENYDGASPKAISGRTSYYQARLAFHYLPQLIPEYCTAHGFGPPSGFRQNSPWPWQARLASGLKHFLKNALSHSLSLCLHGGTA